MKKSSHTLKELNRRMDKIQSEVDKRLDDILSRMKTWTPEERSSFCDEAGEHPLWSSSSESSTEGATAALSAMKSVEYDDLDDPMTLAMECKDKGNAAFKAGKDYFGHCVRHYQDAIKHAEFCAKKECEAVPKTVKQFISTCHSNLASVHLSRGKYISALDSCMVALRVWGDNTKAAWRAAKAAIALGRASSALELAELGSCAGDGGDSASFVPLIREARELLVIQERNAAATARMLQDRASSLGVVREACRERGIQVGPPLFNGMQRTSARPYVDGDGVLHWPVVLLYPAAGQSDYIEDWPESGTFGELLDVVMSNSGPSLPWDVKGEYISTGCDVFFKSNPCKPIPLDLAWTQQVLEETPEESWGDVRWVLCPPEAPLVLPLLQPSYVVADLPVFYIVPRSSSFYAGMKRAAGGEFARLSTEGLDL